jgi:arginyl-tRNA synthetase
MIQAQIKKDLTKVLKKLRISPERLMLEHPANLEHGDYATNIALQVKAKHLRDKPLQSLAPWDLANKIVNGWRAEGLPDYLAKVEVVKPGFINLWLKTEVLSAELGRALKEKNKYGSSDLGKDKSIMFEFSHPNTHKLFHIGHLRTTSLGESLSRLYEALGYKVVRANYQGDVGLHIAKCLWGIKKLGTRRAKTVDGKMNFLGKAYIEGNQAYEKSPKAKEEIIKINAKIYHQDSEVAKLWQETRQWSLAYFEAIYKRLHTRFDRYYFESEVAKPGKKLVLEGLKKGIFKKSEGAIIFPGEKEGLHNRVFINQLGLPTYEAKDMALAKLQFAEYPVQKIVHVVGPEQKGYFQVVFKALEKLFPKTKGKEYHLEYGWVRLKEGKMSSRTGTVITATWLIDEAKREVKKIVAKSDYSRQEKEAIAEVVAVAAVKYWILKFGPSTEIAFDLKESVSLEGDSAPYLQYTHARCQSVLRRAGKTKDQILKTKDDFNAEELALLRTVYKFPEVVVEAGGSFAPNLICNFLFDLAQKYNLFYNKHSILSMTEPRRSLRLALTAAVSQTLRLGLNLLGIEAPERM